jgi:hypothetical protein
MNINQFPDAPALTVDSVLIVEVPDGAGGFNTGKITLAQLFSALAKLDFGAITLGGSTVAASSMAVVTPLDGSGNGVLLITLGGSGGSILGADGTPAAFVQEV